MKEQMQLEKNLDQAGSAGAAAAAAVAIGAALWLAAAALAGKREAWDAAVYWVVAYPAALLACLGLGYRFPQRCWRWPLLLFEAQAVAMAVRNGELGSLLPLGLALFALLALPGLWLARLGARRRGRNAQGPG